MKLEAYLRIFFFFWKRNLVLGVAYTGNRRAKKLSKRWCGGSSEMSKCRIPGEEGDQGPDLPGRS